MPLEARPSILERDRRGISSGVSERKNLETGDGIHACCRSEGVSGSSADNVCWWALAGRTDRIAALEKQAAANATAIAAAQTSGDNSWMLVSSALVLMMSGPGLALFYGGLVR